MLITKGSRGTQLSIRSTRVFFRSWSITVIQDTWSGYRKKKRNFYNAWPRVYRHLKTSWLTATRLKRLNNKVINHITIRKCRDRRIYSRVTLASYARVVSTDWPMHQIQLTYIIKNFNGHTLSVAKCAQCSQISFFDKLKDDNWRRIDVVCESANR